MNDQTSKRQVISFTLRELLLLVVIASLAMMYFNRPFNDLKTHSKALFSLHVPIEYRYWHQRGPNGSGTGQIGSGNEWQPAIGIDVFENFVILHLENGIDRMVEREGLQWFDWRRIDGIQVVENSTPVNLSSSH